MFSNKTVGFDMLRQIYVFSSDIDKYIVVFIRFVDNKKNITAASS